MPGTAGLLGDRAGGGRSGPQQVADGVEVEIAGLTEAEAALAHALAGQPLGEGVADVTAEQMEGEVLLLTGERDLGDAVPLASRRP